jgi:hypothetical protein
MLATTRLTGSLLALALAACTANGGDAGGGGGSGNGDGAGGECLLEIGGLCVIGGPGSDLPNLRCTQTVPAGSAATFTTAGPLCTVTAPLEGCIVYDPELAADGDYDTFATVDQVAGVVDPLLEGSITLSVQSGPVAAGRVAAFLVSLPGGNVDANIFRGLTVSTSLGGVEQESATFDSLLQLDVLGIVGDFGKVLVGFSNTMIYDQLHLTTDAFVVGADIFDTVSVYEACTDAAPAT